MAGGALGLAGAFVAMVGVGALVVCATVTRESSNSVKTTVTPTRQPPGTREKRRCFVSPIVMGRGISDQTERASFFQEKTPRNEETPSKICHLLSMPFPFFLRRKI
jgi:hypothetical protein